MYGLLADLVVLLHLAFILFVVFGALFALRWRWFPWLHLPAMLWGAATEFFHIVCPLTPLENSLRARAGDSGYSGDFITHYIVPVIYPDNLTAQLQWVLGTALVVFNTLLYLYLVYLWRRRANHADCNQY